jgi:bacillithiol biosynthesis cysteine-adding enzyme BshC
MKLVECAVVSDDASRPLLSGVPPLKSECLPFRQVPHTTRFFSDFLASHPQALQFYPRPARIQSWIKDEAARVRYPDDRRAQVAAVLERQNRFWGASPRTFENLARLRSGAAVLVTGQQVGLFGGPLFSILKALSAIRLADEATKVGVDSVPVFWLATEDHDLAEVNHVSLPGPGGDVRKFEVSARGTPDAPVGTLLFEDEIHQAVKQAAELLGENEISEALRQAYRPGENFGSAFARLFAQLFADWGVILLDARDPELHQIAKPIYRAAAERASELDNALLARGQALEAAGYHQQVKVTSLSSLLFYSATGSRVVIHRRMNGGDHEFLLGAERVSQADLLRQIEAAPQHFSANVLLRPVVQDYLLPTLAYTGGAAEVAYFAQAAVVYEALLGRVAPVLPRFSATLVEQKPQMLLDKYGLRLPDLFHGPEKLRERIAERVLPSDLQAAFGKAESTLGGSLTEIQEVLGRLDVTLVDSARVSISKMRYQLGKIRARAARAELRRREVLGRHASLLSSSLYPNHTLQEREVGGIYFLARVGPQLLRALYATIDLDCLDHHVISLA